MKENNKGSMIILTIIGIATLLIAVIGATFAYFTVTVKYNDKPKDVVVQSNTMVIEYHSENSIKYEGAIPGRPEETANNKMRFSVNSTTNVLTATKYDVYLKITKNDFSLANTDETNGTKYTDLVFYLNETNTTPGTNLDNNASVQVIPSIIGNLYSTKLEQYNFQGIETEESNKITGIKDVGVIPLNTDPSNCAQDSLSEDGTACMLKISDGASLGNLGAKDEWYFEIWLKETGTNQNNDQGKFFEASIEIVPHEVQITNEPDLANP